mmetsp:Transcript_32784/g.72432  ORF Transcript_32784/g.72432 Transcript_32784/m.72432 type:complete len:204 (+) Transcript_32784:328-939(+)
MITAQHMNISHTQPQPCVLHSSHAPPTLFPRESSPQPLPPCHHMLALPFLCPLGPPASSLLPPALLPSGQAGTALAPALVSPPLGNHARLLPAPPQRQQVLAAAPPRKAHLHTPVQLELANTEPSQPAIFWCQPHPPPGRHPARCPVHRHVVLQLHLTRLYGLEGGEGRTLPRADLSDHTLHLEPGTVTDAVREHVVRKVHAM